MATVLPPGSPRRVSRPRLLAGLLAAGVVVAGVGGWAANSASRPQLNVAATVPIPNPVVTEVGRAANGRVPWDRPLAVSVTYGTLRSVTAVDPDGQPFEGVVVGDSWTSSTTLLPSSSYHLTATVADSAGQQRRIAITTLTALPATTLHAVLSPGDRNVVGVGQAVIVTLDRAVTSPADRAAVARRLSVATEPATVGAWRWMSPTELHYRAASYWTKGMTMHVAADFTRLSLSGGTWGEGSHTTDYSIGSQLISTVDVATKTMTVVRDGVLLRTVKVSTGRDEYPTKGGVHLVLEKSRLKIMDSSTIGIPRESAGGYYLKVPHSVRISYSGEFVHSAPNSVREQGVSNVSHGCVNLSPADAAWFYDQTIKGDIVNVINAKLPPRLSDPGMSDWNIAFADWAN